MGARSKRARIARGAGAVSATLILLTAGCSDDEPAGNAATTTSTTTAAVTGSVPSGPIVFTRAGPSEDDAAIYTANVDGSDVTEVFAGSAGGARWSPDGTAISFFCCDDGNAAHILDVATGEVRYLEQPDPTLELYCGAAWTSDGERLACEGFGVEDPSLNGIYTIRVSDGGDVTRITSNPDGNDIAGDFSPGGNRLVFMRFEDEQPVGLFTSNADGSDPMRLPTGNLLLDDSGHAGSWSPSGDRILFVARASEEVHKAIWMVSADGGELQQLPITPTCGGPFEPGEHGCYWPRWSPDGEQIVFTRSDDIEDAGIYVVNADGSGIQPVTGHEDDQPDWGR
jgi:Tol biopolymer transport system component